MSPKLSKQLRELAEALDDREEVDPDEIVNLLNDAAYEVDQLVKVSRAAKHLYDKCAEHYAHDDPEDPFILLKGALGDEGGDDG